MQGKRQGERRAEGTGGVYPADKAEGIRQKVRQKGQVVCIQLKQLVLSGNEMLQVQKS